MPRLLLKGPLVLVVVYVKQLVLRKHVNSSALTYYALANSNNKVAQRPSIDTSVYLEVAGLAKRLSQHLRVAVALPLWAGP